MDRFGYDTGVLVKQSTDGEIVQTKVTWPLKYGIPDQWPRTITLPSAKRYSFAPQPKGTWLSRLMDRLQWEGSSLWRRWQQRPVGVPPPVFLPPPPPQQEPGYVTVEDLERFTKNVGWDATFDFFERKEREADAKRREQYGDLLGGLFERVRDLRIPQNLYAFLSGSRKLFK